ncbi:MAG: ASPIC/UnbV domain-containing protein, partial [Planctomycetia bacterium]
GAFFSEKQVGRGVAVADYDADGDLDAVVVHQNAPAALLENHASSGDWLAVRCIGIRSNRRGIGCRVTVRRGDRVWMQEIVGGSSYASTHEPLLVFGLGERAGDCEVTVRWPGGGVQELRGVASRQSLTVLERVDGGP